MLRKLFLLVSALTISLSLIHVADSYTSAAVMSDAVVRVVESEKALIAVKQEGQKLIVTNNMTTMIGISAYIKDGEFNLIPNDKECLAAGKSVSFDIPNKDSKPCIEFKANWNGGSANIDYTVN